MEEANAIYNGDVNVYKRHYVSRAKLPIPRRPQFTCPDPYDQGLAGFVDGAAAALALPPQLGLWLLAHEHLSG